MEFIDERALAKQWSFDPTSSFRSRRAIPVAWRHYYLGSDTSFVVTNVLKRCGSFREQARINIVFQK